MPHNNVGGNVSSATVHERKHKVQYITTHTKPHTVHTKQHSSARGDQVRRRLAGGIEYSDCSWKSSVLNRDALVNIDL